MKVLSLEPWMFVSYWCWVHWMDVCVVLVLGPLDRLDVDPVLDHLPQRRHLTQTTHLFNCSLDSVINFLLCCEATNTKSDR